jgi:uncharacterized membrane protein
MKQIIKLLYFFIIGGLIYYGLEILWRGYSHWSMMILGGLCFVLIGLINELYTWDMSLISQMYISAIVITVLELITGLIVNIWFSWGVWDYSQVPYNFMGQICLLYTNLWFLLSLPAIVIDDYIRYLFMGDEKPKYKVF